MDALKNGWQKFYDALHRNKALEYGLYILIAALVAFLYFGTGDDKSAASKEADKFQQSEDVLEQKLTRTLERIDGAGRVEVMITYETAGEIVPAMSRDTQSSGSEGGAVSENESTRPMTVNVQGGSAPMVLMEKQPVVRGAIIVAEGAKDIGVRLDLMRAAQTVLDVSPDRVEVFTMEQS